MSQPHPPRPEDQPAQQPSPPLEPRTQQIPVIRPDAQPEAGQPEAGRGAQPAASPAAQPEPRPAFLSQSEPTPPAQPSAQAQAPAAVPAQPTPPPAALVDPPGAFTTAVLPAVDASGAPQQVPGPATPPLVPQQVAAPQAAVLPAPPVAGAPQSGGPERVWPQPGPASAEQSPTGAPQPTGPLDIVPGFSTPAPPPVPPQGSTAVTAEAPTGDGADGGPGAGTRARAAGRALGAKLGSGLRPGRRPGHGLDRAVLTGLGLGVLALVALEFGLTLDPGDRSLWSAVPSWSAFATLAAVVALAPLALSLAPQRLPARSAWRIGAAGVAGLATFWVLIALPLVASDRGFLLTAALALAGGALWLAPGRDG